MKSAKQKLDRLWWASFLGFFLFLSSTSWPQGLSADSFRKESKTETPEDTLGRSTPRGTVLGFISAARKGNGEIAVLYLNTSLRGAPAHTLARQLAIVLDRRLPARLNQLSDKPEGAIPDPLKPNEDLVGTISTNEGDLDILVERGSWQGGAGLAFSSNPVLDSRAFQD
jgi:MscS family membrane protein